MNTHDVLAFAIATEAVRRIRGADAHWTRLFSTNVYPTSSRTWPMPDFVIVDDTNSIQVAAEFKPPNQSKREYLTGLGQASAYTRDFHYALLVLPETADDDYPIADHVHQVLNQQILAAVPITLLSYDPRTLSAESADFTVLRQSPVRGDAPQHLANLDSSFYAKWRDISPIELSLFLDYLYQEGKPRRSGAQGTIRDRAFDRLWIDIQAGEPAQWDGTPRSLSNTNKTAYSKNYRNFITHIGWCMSSGKLTEEGLEALRLIHQYEAASQLFRDYLTHSLLMNGKHLVLINAINIFQDRYYRDHGQFASEEAWLDLVEGHLEDEGLLKRNPGRAAAAIRNEQRQFLKAEKDLWRKLNLIIPYGPHGGRVYHPGRGIIFDWSRITSLLS